MSDTSDEELFRLGLGYLYKVRTRWTELSEMKQAEELHGMECSEDIDDRLERLNECIATIMDLT